MAIARDVNNSDPFLTYVAMVALFCGISCTILMLRFKGFKASLNLSTGKRTGREHYELAPQMSVIGAYRANRDEFFENVNYSETRQKITPSMVKLPPPTRSEDTTGNVKLSKSTGDLSRIENIPVQLRKSTPNVAGTASVSNIPQNSKQAKKELKEQKKLEKQRLVEEKKREKLAAQERLKQEELRKEREKQAAIQQAKDAKAMQGKNKTGAPKPPPLPPPEFQTMGQPSQPKPNPPSQRPTQHTTNTLDSSISRNSGPPPYTDNIVPNRSDYTKNTSFVKPLKDSSSWDLISQHRQQMERTPGVSGIKSRTQSVNRDNSEA